LHHHGAGHAHRRRRRPTVQGSKLLAPDRKLVLAGLTPTVDKVFRLTRMDSVFELHGDVENAVSKYRGTACDL